VILTDLLAGELRRDPARPFLTWYDDETGERVELSVATMANWAAKTANFLIDEQGLEPGDRVSIDLPAHWLAPVVALGTWTAGVALDLSAAPVALPGEPSEFMQLVLAQPDDVFGADLGPDHLALVAGERTWTSAQLAQAAQRAVETHGLPGGVRILSSMALDTIDGLDASLLVPLAAGGSVVFVAHPGPDGLARKAETERATHTAGVEVAGLPRLDRAGH
jgi:hypothetical protein